eukprot:15424966-Alexandrium_andersonii.AAC.1
MSAAARSPACGMLATRSLPKARVQTSSGQMTMLQTHERLTWLENIGCRPRGRDTPSPARWLPGHGPDAHGPQQPAPRPRQSAVYPFAPLDDSLEILPDGRITNAEMRRDAAALRAAFAQSDFASLLGASQEVPPSSSTGASGPAAGAGVARVAE